MYFGQHLSKTDHKVISNAISLIQEGACNRVDLGHGMIIYKVPSNNPNKYTIRLDIKMEVHPDDART
jgi:hypothetical protein